MLYASGGVVGCVELEMATSQCFENPPSLSATCGSGNLQEIRGHKTYVTGPQDSKLAILLISDVFDQLEEIKTLLSSNTKSHKPFAYSTLLHLQEQSSSSTDPSLIQSLADASRPILSSILTDVSNDDEEIAVQALKCLGFMIYHPTIIAAILALTKGRENSETKDVVLGIAGDDANLIVDSLTKVIITTRMKAIQAVMKVATQLNEKMRDTSNIWAPPIYRRLVSIDKRVRDMSERCLLKIRSTICPPPLTLSKYTLKSCVETMTAVTNLSNRLQSRTNEVQHLNSQLALLQRMYKDARAEISVLKAENKELKRKATVMFRFGGPPYAAVEEQGVVIMPSGLAWEGLIDALIQPPIRAPEMNMVAEHGIQQGRTCEGNNSGREGEGFSKSVKLIMTPIIGIMTSKCIISVHSSCLNTWCYLLHKLDTSVNCPSMVKTVCEPIFDAVFRVGPDSKSIWLWNICLDLLDDFILIRSSDLDDDLNKQVNYEPSAKTPTTGPPVSVKCSWKHYPIKWLSWDLNSLDFCIKMIRILISQGQGSMVTVPKEIKSLACNSALRIFKSVLKGVRNVLKNSSINYDEVMLCLNTILGLVKEIYKDLNSENGDINDSLHTSLQFVEAVIEELEPSILGSPIYKIALDLKYVDYLQSVNEATHAGVLGVRFTMYMDMVSPIVYLIILYFCGLFKSTFNAPGEEFILQNACRYLKFVLSSFDPSEILHAIIGLLYKHVGFDYLKIWIAIASGLKDYIDEAKDVSLLKTESDSLCCLEVCQILSYSFAVCSCPQKQSTMVQSTGLQESSIVSLQSQRKLELECVFEVWKSLYVCVNCASGFESSTLNSFADDLLLTINGCLDANTKVFECGTVLNPTNNDQDINLLSLCGNVAICVLEHILNSGISSRGSKGRKDGDYKRSSGVNNSLGFVARFMTLSRMMAETNAPNGLAVISRVFSALVRFVGWLHLKEDILSFIQIISNQLLQWLSFTEIPCEDTNHQLQLLWTETLNCLRRSHPPIIFDSSFLELQAPLLETTLDHPNPSISEPAITFWNFTYAATEVKLDYPQSLIPVLDKLSRNRKISLCKRSLGFLAPPRYRVTATHNMSSKRVELVEHKVTGIDYNDKQSLCPKRKRRELTEHQKEVRRAQQGRERDCNGHGPGIRTYTSADFSQGNEESQDGQEIRDADSILEMLRRSS
ncbi:unnamed protein product [Camellia sinensis]